MLLTPGTALDTAADGNWQRMETAGHAAIWCGFLFVRGWKAGRDSVEQLLRTLQQAGAPEALAQAKGSFAILVHEKDTKQTFCSVDPFGLMRLFVGGNCVSDDLFALVRQIGHDEDRLDRVAIASFLRFGFYGLGRTVDRRIRSLAGDRILLLSPGSDSTEIAKARPSAGADFDWDLYVRDVITAIDGERVSLDLTGGYDTRLLAASLVGRTRAVVECATSGQDGNEDRRGATRIAQILSFPHFEMQHRVGGLEGRLPTLLRLTNGQSAILTYDSIFQFTVARSERGATLSFSGVGGELWKDIFWLQDFPFLSGRPALDRFYRLRIEPRAQPTAHLSQEFLGAYAAAGVEWREAMQSRFGALGRTAAYDSIIGYLRIPAITGPTVSASVHCGVPTFFPLLDSDGVKASMAMRKRERLFSRWQRRTIHRKAPELSPPRTTDGLSARVGAAALGDLPFYAANKTARLAQKIVQKLGLPDLIRLSLDDPHTLETGKNLAAATHAFQRLREVKILAATAEPQALGRIAFDRLLTAGLTIAEISD
ncbi:MAG TPA: hypothetical protein VII49_00345 [Rhizomicrobium sp.]